MQKVSSLFTYLIFGVWESSDNLPWLELKKVIGYAFI